LPKRWQRELVDRLIERIRYYVTLREDTRYYHTMAFATVRQKLLTLEQELLQTSRLRCADDIFFLQWDEAEALAQGRLEWPDVEHKIRSRRQRHQQQSRVSPPELINLQRASEPPAADRADSLTGDCACPGVVEGNARVIFDPTIDQPLQPGEILVAPYTDPAWTPLFPAAAAIVVEVGSFLSHAGTIAREYQIPCVVDVANCTRNIQTGQRLRVNATEGIVEILT